jgi:hypothetical protein
MERFFALVYFVDHETYLMIQTSLLERENARLSSDVIPVRREDLRRNLDGLVLLVEVNSPRCLG